MEHIPDNFKGQREKSTKDEAFSKSSAEMLWKHCEGKPSRGYIHK
jgi:hypothetical protein